MYTTDADFDTAFGEEEIVPSCRGCGVSDECGLLYQRSEVDVCVLAAIHRGYVQTVHRGSLAFWTGRFCGKSVLFDGESEGAE